MRLLIVILCMLTGCNTISVNSTKPTEPTTKRITVIRLKRSIDAYNLNSKIPPYEQDKILDWLDSLSKRELEKLFDRFVPEYKYDEYMRKKKFSGLL